MVSNNTEIFFLQQLLIVYTCRGRVWSPESLFLATVTCLYILGKCKIYWDPFPSNSKLYRYL